MIYIREVITKDDLKRIKKLLKRLTWIDGLISYNGGHDVKLLEQAESDEYTDEIVQHVFNNINKDSEFLIKTSARSSGTPIISRVNAGGYYKPHQDAFNNGDYSTTVFLSDPDSYVGGELCLYVNDKVQKVKLPAGYAVTYDTGYIHAVSEVTKGTRHCAVFWTHSEVVDPKIREMTYKLEVALKNIKNKDLAMDVVEASKNPTFLIASVIRDLKKDSRR